MAISIGMEIDTNAFDAAEARFGGGVGQRLVEVASKLSAIEAEKRVMMGFRASMNPYGEAWEPLKHRSGKPLIDTGRLRSSFHGRPTDDGFSIGTNVQYAVFHQEGAHVKGGKTVRAARGKKGRFAKPGSKKHTYSTTHISGEATIPARQMLPTKDRGWGPEWNSGLRKAVLLAFKQVLSAK